MSRTIELGRAVLDLPSAQLQVWFTTLITVSPQQNSIDIQHLDKQALLSLLFSGDTWVGRGQGMHFVLELTVNGEPLGRTDLDSLAKQIVNAPVWSQLNMCPSLSMDEMRDGTVLLDDGKLRINIKHVQGDTNIEPKPCHRIFSSVPFADVVPPKGVPNLGLSSIRFAMEFIKIQRPPKTTRSKQTKKSDRIDTPNTNIEESEIINPRKVPLTYETEDTDDDDDDILSYEDALLHEGDEASNQIPVTARPEAAHGVSIQNKKKRKRPLTDPRFELASTEPPSLLELAELEMLTDAAMRLAVCNILPKRATGLKARANTFIGGLADIAPTLWSPGYLPAFSQRSHFLPIISRSLGRATSGRAKTLSLHDKIARLIACSPINGLNPLRQNHLMNNDEKNITKSLNAQLWMHTQRNIFIKTASRPLLTFCAPDPQLPSLLDSDTILDSFSRQVKVGNNLSLQANHFQDTNNGFHGPVLSKLPLTSDRNNQLLISDLASASAHSELSNQHDDLLHSPLDIITGSEGHPIVIDYPTRSNHDQVHNRLPKDNIHETMPFNSQPLQFGGDGGRVAQQLWEVEDIEQSAAGEPMLLTF
ncbi:hypothetical protein K505DRAFT_360864 [Melanomma pulvis-pyrius CBS 109.77]|uniref:Uncharacterized protein n=1 Tax=Melanomma pulvis-pyrius CBS 109.77 TaxID=1314802 RepID=A0A6A6XEG2_9PLEO|nr:hypothetical protein K505DRAFT_360864 [Melanomma pulvis-pyrius CBS 109.77]